MGHYNNARQSMAADRTGRKLRSLGFAFGKYAIVSEKLDVLTDGGKLWEMELLKTLHTML